MATTASQRVVAAVLDEAITLHQRVQAGSAEAIVAAAAAIRAAFDSGGKLLVFGNGGSAADAQHLAAELVGRFQRERPAMPVLALTTDASVLTSVANDYGYERVFARQVEALGRPGDVAMGITTSGGSPNVLAALEVAHARGLQTIALTGRDGGRAGTMADVHINVPSPSAARAQEVHRTIIHALCELLEAERE
jgi:D-sedoheptulose 7-phosphate isomerase